MCWSWFLGSLTTSLDDVPPQSSGFRQSKIKPTCHQIYRHTHIQVHLHRSIKCDQWKQLLYVYMQHTVYGWVFYSSTTVASVLCNLLWVYMFSKWESWRQPKKFEQTQTNFFWFWRFKPDWASVAVEWPYQSILPEGYFSTWTEPGPCEGAWIGEQRQTCSLSPNPHFPPEVWSWQSYTHTRRTFRTHTQAGCIEPELTASRFLCSNETHPKAANLQGSAAPASLSHFY